MCCWFSICTAVCRHCWLLETDEDIQQHTLLVVCCFDLWVVFLNFKSPVHTEVLGAEASAPGLRCCVKLAGVQPVVTPEQVSLPDTGIVADLAGIWQKGRKSRRNIPETIVKKSANDKEGRSTIFLRSQISCISCGVM